LDLRLLKKAGFIGERRSGSFLFPEPFPRPAPTKPPGGGLPLQLSLSPGKASGEKKKAKKAKAPTPVHSPLPRTSPPHDKRPLGFQESVLPF